MTKPFHKYWLVHSPEDGMTVEARGSKHEADTAARYLANTRPGKRVAVFEVVSAFQGGDNTPLELADTSARNKPESCTIAEDNS